MKIELICNKIEKVFNYYVFSFGEQGSAFFELTVKDKEKFDYRIGEKYIFSINKDIKEDIEKEFLKEGNKNVCLNELKGEEKL